MLHTNKHLIFGIGSHLLPRIFKINMQKIYKMLFRMTDVLVLPIQGLYFLYNLSLQLM